MVCVGGSHVNTRQQRATHTGCAAAAVTQRRRCGRPHLKRIAASAAAAPLPSGTTQDYLNWAKETGILAPKVAEASFEGLRGAQALQEVAAGELFVSVPRAAALVVEPRQRCPCPDFVGGQFWKQAPWYAQMAILLLRERSRRRQSPLCGYIEQLPESIDTPVRWADEDLRELQYQPLEEEVQRQRTAWRQLYQQFAEAARGLGGAGVTWEEWVWAAENVRSRAFSGPYAGAPLQERLRLAAVVAVAGLAYVAWAQVSLQQALNGAIAATVFNLMYDILLSSKLKWYAMCPVIDLLNHSSRVDSTIEFEYFQDTFVASTSHTTKARDQIFISYGRQPSDSLLQFYGFVESNNPNDTYTLCADLGSGSGARQQVKVTLNAKGSFTPESLAEARAAAAPGGADGDKALPAAAEAALQEQLLAALQGELAGKATSLADDERLVKAGHLMAARVRLAAQFRAEKKRLLQRGVQRAQKRLAKLRGV